AEVGLAVDEVGEVAAEVWRGDVVPPAAGLVECNDERGVLPVRARLEPGDEITDEGVLERRTRIARVPVINLWRLDPRDRGQGRHLSADRCAGQRRVEDADVALVAVGLRVAHVGIERPRVREVGGRREVLERIVVWAVSVYGGRRAGAE